MKEDLVKKLTEDSRSVLADGAFAIIIARIIASDREDFASADGDFIDWIMCIVADLFYIVSGNVAEVSLFDRVQYVFHPSRWLANAQRRNA